MFFNYSDSFYVSDEDFDEMLRYMEKGAFCSVSP